MPVCFTCFSIKLHSKPHSTAQYSFTSHKKATASCHSATDMTCMLDHLWCGRMIYRLFCFLCWLWIYFSTEVLPRLVWLWDFTTALWDTLQNKAGNHLGLHSEWWESRLCCTLVLRDTQTPWGAGIMALWWRVWNAPWQTSKTCWLNGVSKARRLLCSEAQEVY